MYCKECGEENKNNAKFCSNCGKPMKDYTAPTKQEDLLMPQDLIEAEDKRKHLKKRFIARQIVSIILIITACACMLVSNFVIKNHRTIQLALSCIAILLTIIYIALIVVNAKVAKKLKNEKAE